MVGTVLILSALHGLIALDELVSPSDVKMGPTIEARAKAGNVTAERVRAQAVELGIGHGDEVFALLPTDYLRVLDEALAGLDVSRTPTKRHEASAFKRAICNHILAA